MILEELVGVFVSLVAQAPAISRENLQNEFECTLENSEQDGSYDGLIHREYDEQPTATELPYNETDDTVRLVQTRRNFSESFLRSIKANIGLITVVVFILALFTIGVVLLGLTITDYCPQSMQKNRTSAQNSEIVKIVVISVILLPPFSWFPASIAMSFGFKEFRKHYLSGLFVFQLVMWLLALAYQIFFYDRLAPRTIEYNKYRSVDIECLRKIMFERRTLSDPKYS